MTGRAALPLISAAIVGAWAPSAFAQVPGLPVPVPPAPQLPVPVPVPTVPQVPVVQPPPPPPPPPPPAPPPPAQVSGVPAWVGNAVSTVTGNRSGGGSGSGGASAGGGTTASGSAGGSAASGPGARPRDRKVRTSKTRIRNRGPRSERDVATITFSVARPSVVRFRIRREAPDCVVLGRFSLRASAGLNGIPFAGRFRGAPLPPGTYTLAATASRRGRNVSLGSVTVVIVADESSARPDRSTCGNGASDATATGDDVSAAAAVDDGSGTAATDLGDALVDASKDVTEAGGVAGAEAGGDEEGGAAGKSDSSGEGSGRILGTVPNPVENAPAWVQPLLLLALAAAILLLLVAALPATAVRPAGAGPVVIRRRSEFALAGALILGAVAVTALVF
jgi:hypothetical protein